MDGGKCVAPSASTMRFEKVLNVAMVADHVEVEQAVIGGEDQTHGEPKPPFVETPPKSADAASTMRMRIAEGLTHRLD